MANRSAQVALRAPLAAVVLALISACTSGSSSAPPAPTRAAPATLVLSDVRWLGDAHEGFWKVAETVENHGESPTGASITCSLVDATGATSTSAKGTLRYVAPSKSQQTFVVVEDFKHEPTAANCTVSATQAVPPKQKPPAKPTLYPSAIAFFDFQHAILVGQMATRRCFDHTSCPGIIETTSDGGKTWRPTAHYPKVVGWVTETDGVAWATLGDCTPERCGSSALLRSEDRGRSWHQVSTAKVHQPSFVDRDVGWALGPGNIETSSRFARTSDGGRTWSIAKGPCPHDAPVAANISALSTTHVIVMCSWGQSATDMEGKAVMSTTDGGQNWRMLAHTGVPTWHTSEGGLPIIGYKAGAFFLPDGHGWMWADRGFMYMSVDAGASWHRQGPQPNDDVTNMRSAWFLSANYGYALLFRGRMQLIKTDNGGRSWSTVVSWPNMR